MLCIHIYLYICWLYEVVMMPVILLLLMEEIPHQLIRTLSHYLQGFLHPRWLFGISSINSITKSCMIPAYPWLWSLVIQFILCCGKNAPVPIFEVWWSWVALKWSPQLVGWSFRLEQRKRGNHIFCGKLAIDLKMCWGTSGQSPLDSLLGALQRFGWHCGGWVLSKSEDEEGLRMSNQY